MLVRLGSDDLCNKNPKWFRFVVAWATEPSFKDLIKNSWNNNEDWPEVISSLTEKISKWNNMIFGNINRRNRTLMRRLSGINRIDPMGSNHYLNHLQDTLWKKYERALLHEEILWCQRARHKWIQFGDRNTKFFHTSMLIRKKRNKVEALKDKRDNWVTDKDKLKEMANQFFRDLYSKEELVVSNSIKNAFHRLNHTRMGIIEAEVTSEEIKDAFFSMGAFIALGRDRTGYMLCFFRVNGALLVNLFAIS